MHATLEKLFLEIQWHEIWDLMHAEKCLSLEEGFLSPFLEDAQD